jgi:hypothetical protein
MFPVGPSRVCDEKTVDAFITEAEESALLNPLPGND